MRILSLHPDAFGARGGIAAYNRDMITAWCSHPRTREVVALALRRPEFTPALPSKLTWRADFEGDRKRFALSAAKQAVLHGPWDAVVCCHVNLLPVAAIASWLARAPLSLVVYGVDVWERHASRVVNESLRRVASIASISQITLDKMQRWHDIGRVPCFVCPNALHPEAFGAGDKPPALVDRFQLHGDKVILTVARLNSQERYKGIDEVIELMPELRQIHPSLRFLVIGSGDDRERLEAKAKRLGLGEAVIFAGFVPDEELASHYRLADAFVMPGSGEGFGFVYLEALACGVPVVASKVDGSREAVRNGQLGELVDPDDLADIKRGILAALERGRGDVPEGLSYFYWDEFERRCHEMLDAIIVR